MAMLTTMPRPFSLLALPEDFVGATTFSVLIRTGKHHPSRASDSRWPTLSIGTWM
jgi:hypothetical protein